MNKILSLEEFVPRISKLRSMTLVVSQEGKTTTKLGGLKTGNIPAPIVGPLGCPSRIEKIGNNRAIVAFGYAILITMLPVAGALKEAENKLIALLLTPDGNLFSTEKEWQIIKPLGVCYVIISGVVKFGCVDGPEFDGWEVDLDEFLIRHCTYSGKARPVVNFNYLFYTR